MTPDFQATQSESAEKCWACPAPAVVRYLAWDEPDMPGPYYCGGCAERFPPMPGIGRIRL